MQQGKHFSECLAHIHSFVKVIINLKKKFINGQHYLPIEIAHVKVFCILIRCLQWFCVETIIVVSLFMRRPRHKLRASVCVYSLPLADEK